MGSRKVPNASSILKIECDSSIQTYATVKKHHGPCTCEIDYYYFNSKVDNGQNVSYERLMARLSLNICPVTQFYVAKNVCLFDAIFLDQHSIRSAVS